MWDKQRMDDQRRTIQVPVPGIDGVHVAYDPLSASIEHHQIEIAATLLSHWLKQAVSVNTYAVRHALRHINDLEQLGQTELAHLLVPNLATNDARGAALHSLLITSIRQLKPGGHASLRQQRSFLILHDLYILRKHRLQISAELGLSERQYQRELNAALAQLKRMLIHTR